MTDQPVPDPPHAPHAAPPILGYCTNVHAGARIAEVRRALAEHAGEVRRLVNPGGSLPVGLWLSNKAAAELIGDPGQFEALKNTLRENGLRAFTFNAFPWGDFHGPVVKQRVYRPDWAQYERLEYTIAVAALAADLVDESEEVSISTLPVAWRGFGAGEVGEVDATTAAKSLRSIARHLARVEAETGRLIHLDLEPEPGCALDTAGGTVRFFSEHLLRRGDEEFILRHLRICHDVCHSAVMFEDQRAALATYAAAGIRVGKVQVSAAVELDLESLPPAERAGALAELARFAEPRYLHQTSVRDPVGRVRHFEDLPDALNTAPSAGCWRTHFHVPVFVGRLGALRSTAGQIAPALAAARELHGTRHFEIETYAWGVLPADLRTLPLAEGIAREFRFVSGLGVPGIAA